LAGARNCLIMSPRQVNTERTSSCSVETLCGWAYSGV
jgi:hypothetical protein